MPDTLEGRYVTLDDLKQQMQIATSDLFDPTVLSRALRAAEDMVDEHCRRGADGQPRPMLAVDPTVAGQKTARLYDLAGAVLNLDDTVAVDTVEVRPGPAGTFVPVDGFELEPINAAADGRPYTRLVLGGPVAGRVRVTGWFGWPETPASVIEAVLLQAARFAQRRNAAFGVAPIVGLDGTTGMRLQARLDADVELLLKPLRRHPVLI